MSGVIGRGGTTFGKGGLFRKGGLLRPKKPEIPEIPEGEPIEPVQAIQEDAGVVRRRERKRLQLRGRGQTVLSGIAAALKRRLGE